MRVTSTVEPSRLIGFHDLSYGSIVRGILVNPSNTTTNRDPILISNNMVDLQGVPFDRIIGLELYQNFHLSYNTIHIGGVSQNGSDSYGLWVGSHSPQTIINNIIVNDRTGNETNYQLLYDRRYNVNARSVRLQLALQWG